MQSYAASFYAFHTHNLKLNDKMCKQNHFFDLPKLKITFTSSETFEKEQNTGSKSFFDRMAEVTGSSSSPVDQVRKEKETGMFLSLNKTGEHGPYKSIDWFDQAAILHKITKFYLVRNQLPTLRTLHQVLTEDVKFHGSLSKSSKDKQYMRREIIIIIIIIIIINMSIAWC